MSFLAGCTEGVSSGLTNPGTETVAGAPGDVAAEINYGVDITLEAVEEPGTPEATTTATPSSPETPTATVGNSALEAQLERTFEQINAELSGPLDGFIVTSQDRTVAGDSLSFTARGVRARSLDLGGFRERTLADFDEESVGSMDGSFGGDSWDFAFEKQYPVVEIEGRQYVPATSITISVTTYEVETEPPEPTETEMETPEPTENEPATGTAGS